MNTIRTTMDLRIVVALSGLMGPARQLADSCAFVLADGERLVLEVPASIPRKMMHEAVQETLRLTLEGELGHRVRLEVRRPVRAAEPVSGGVPKATSGPGGAA
jgi:hypothetical protein